MRDGRKRNGTWILWPLLCLASPLAGFGQTRVEDIFGRPLNQRGLALVDRDGYMANQLIKFYVLPPTNVVFPGSAALMASGVRLYFESPGTASTSGPSQTISFASAADRVPVRLSIF